MLRLDANLPKPFLHTGFAPLRAVMRPGEKVAHRLGEVPQRLLLHGLGACCQPVVLGAGDSQLSTLFVVARRAASRLPVLVLLDGQVPHEPRMATMLGQRRRLVSGRNQPVSRHTSNLAATTDKLPKGQAGPAPAKARGIHAKRTND